ncbi:head-tail connector protein [Pseudomonas sp. USHLN015]|uniref:head-tail connector protein n=1 Tax=Pseudomonas sp. USHLN015 TaxID=3081296 RepID=UPI00301BF943
MVALELVKQHLRVEHGEEDALIQGYLDAAKAHVEKYCDREIVAEPTDPDAPPIDLSTQMLLTKDVEQAILLLVGHWYNNREATVLGVSTAALPFGVEALLWSRRSFR